MRSAWLLISGALVLAGCAQDKSTTAKGAAGAKASPRGLARGSSTNSPAAIITPGSTTNGKVASVRPGSRFAVLSFPIGFMPASDRRFNVYRSGLKVGEIKITGPQRDTHTVADIVAGECQAGDEVRED